MLGEHSSTKLGNGFALTLNSSNNSSLTFNGLGNPDLGDININLRTGSLIIQNGTANTNTLGRASGTVTITGGSTLQILSAATTLYKKFA